MARMTVTHAKANLRYYLQDAREALAWKFEYDIRRPLVPTGTNLLGLVKHLAAAEFGYFADTFGRPGPDQLTLDESSTDWDLFAQPDESREYITDRYRRRHLPPRRPCGHHPRTHRRSYRPDGPQLQHASQGRDMVERLSRPHRSLGSRSRCTRGGR
jgi:hypothetical protein